MTTWIQLKNLQLSMVRRPYRQYSYDPEHMLCHDCVEQVLSQRFYKWWLAEQKSPCVNSKSTALWNMSNTNSYRSQLQIRKTAGGGGNVEFRGCAFIQWNWIWAAWKGMWIFANSVVWSSIAVQKLKMVNHQVGVTNGGCRRLIKIHSYNHMLWVATRI